MKRLMEYSVPLSSPTSTALSTQTAQQEVLISFFKNLELMLAGEWGTRGYCNSIYQFGDWPLCGDDVQPGEVPVFSFGIADDYDFEAAAGLAGFQVYAFDPTRSYPYKLSKNVNFYGCGLRGVVAKNWSHSSYGDTVGELFSLPEILENVGIVETQNFILKLDCEGCEWEALSMLSNFPPIFERIKQINIEMHFTKSLRVDDVQVLKHIANTYQSLRKFGFVPWYMFPQGGSKRDRYHLEEILHLGFPKNLCCFEVGFLKNPLSKLSRKNILAKKRVLPRENSIWKWGQIWGHESIEHVSHYELSKNGRGQSIIKNNPSFIINQSEKQKCFP